MGVQRGAIERYQPTGFFLKHFSCDGKFIKTFILGLSTNFTLLPQRLKVFNNLKRCFFPEHDRVGTIECENFSIAKVWCCRGVLY